MDTSVEYRVRPVTRYIVTRFEDNGQTGRVSEHGEYGNAHLAYEVGYALCKAEHERLGFPPGDPRIQYPAADSQYMVAEALIVTDPPSQFAAAMQKTSA